MIRFIKKNKLTLILLFIVLIVSCVNSENTSKVKHSEEEVLNNSISDKFIKEEKPPLVNKEQQEFTFILNINRELDDYKGNLKHAIKLLNNKNALTNIAIESLIPINFKEYLYYYSISYPANNPKKFNKIDSLIIKKAKDDVGNCIKRYCNLAGFVDGEYAEGFFDEVLHIAEENSVKFCNVYSLLTDISKKKLEDIYFLNCNNQIR